MDSNAGSTTLPTLSEEQSAQYDVTVPFLALYGSASAYARENGGGFSFDGSAAELIFPLPVTKTLGLTPSTVMLAKGAEHDGLIRVLFEPGKTNLRNYWSTVFGTDQPSLVIEFAYSGNGEDMEVWPYDEWLVWPWHKSADEQAEALKTARERQRRLEDDVQVFDLTQRSVMDGPKSALFEGVARHFAYLP